MTDGTENEQALYYALIAGAAEYDGLPAVLLAVWSENDKTVSGCVIEQFYTFNNNITHITKPDPKDRILRGRIGTRTYRASKRNILATFASEGEGVAGAAEARLIATTTVDEFGESVKIKEKLAALAVLESQVRDLRIEVQTLRRVSWDVRFKAILDSLRASGATKTWTEPEEATA